MLNLLIIWLLCGIISVSISKSKDNEKNKK